MLASFTNLTIAFGCYIIVFGQQAVANQNTMASSSDPKYTRIATETDAVQLNSYGHNAAAWYMDLTNMSPELYALFFPSKPCQETQMFLDQSVKTANSYCSQYIRSFLTAILSTGLSKTSINGLINYGGMFLFSEQQLRQFLGVPDTWSSRDKSVLDLGAGNGDVSIRMRGLFENIYATEMSWVMQWRLRQKGIHILDVHNWHTTNTQFNLITAFNLLDRHYDPLLLLSQLRALALRSNCDVALSLVLPISQYVEFHINRSNGNRPLSWISVDGRTFNEHAISVIKNVLEPAGFQIVRWTRLPYLCEGDLYNSIYYLSDAMFLMRPIPYEQTDSEAVHMPTIEKKDFIAAFETASRKEL